MSVFFNKQRQKWEAKISVNKVQYSIGIYDSEYEARIAYANEFNKNQYDKPKVKLHSKLWFEEESQRQLKEFADKYK